VCGELTGTQVARLILSTPTDSIGVRIGGVRPCWTLAHGQPVIEIAT
jgi:hypothetical protein